jgi:DNA-binding transcriptional LysR family regulator
MDWDKFRVFHAVADAGSLTHAGETLNLSQSAVSRQIQALERELDTNLFRRHARGLLLTEQGEKLFEMTSRMEKEVEITRTRIKETKEEVKGGLRLTTTVGFGTIWLAPRLNNFMDAYPSLFVDLILTERVLDLAMREADIAIRMRPSFQSDVIQRPILDIKLGLYASKQYIEKHKPINKLEDLSDHRILVYSPSIPQSEPALEWLSSLIQRDLKPALSVNNYYGVLQAACHSIGISILPSYMAVTRPELINIFPDLQSPGHKSFLCYPVELKNSKRVRLFNDFIETEIAKDTTI